PEGGSGKLQTAPIVSTVTAPVSGNGYYINYDQKSDISLVFAPAEGSTILVYGYGTSFGLMGDYTDRDQSWVSIPSRTLADGKIAFDLLMPFEVSGKASARIPSGHQGFNKIWVAKIDKDTPDDQKLTSYRLEASRMIGRYLSELPTSLRDEALDNVTDKMAWKLVFGGSDDYSAFIAYTPVYTVNSYTINIKKEYTDPGEIAGHIAHESGHYMFHAIAGNSTYMTVYSQMPWDTSKHGTGDVNDRKAMFIEDPAYFSDYYQNGSVGAVANPTEPKSFVYSSLNLPWKVDAPSIEGFGCMMLAGLNRTKDTIVDLYSTEKVKFRTVPVINSSFTDIFGLLYQKPVPTDIDLLRERIRTYLAGAGKEKYFQPYLHSMGWSYSVTGKFVDAAGNPLANATAKNFYNDGVQIWVGGATDKPSAADGTFSVPYGVFGGKSILRVYNGKDSVDVDLDIDWAKPTNVPINRGTLTISEPTVTKTFNLSFTAHDTANWGTTANFKIDVTYEITGTDLQPNATRKDDGLDCPLGKPISVKASGKVTMEAVKLRDGTDDNYTEYAYGTPTVPFKSVTYSGISVTETKYANPYNASFTFSGAGQLLYIEAPVVVPYTKKIYNKGYEPFISTGYLSLHGNSCYLYSK
ncbi:MAG: hypothetical protein WCU00_02610, partial [Candidatus Latescibacterota bacterium]